MDDFTANVAVFTGGQGRVRIFLKINRPTTGVRGEAAWCMMVFADDKSVGRQAFVPGKGVGDKRTENNLSRKNLRLKAMCRTILSFRASKNYSRVFNLC